MGSNSRLTGPAMALTRDHNMSGLTPSYALKIICQHDMKKLFINLKYKMSFKRLNINRSLNKSFLQLMSTLIFSCITLSLLAVKTETHLPQHETFRRIEKFSGNSLSLSLLSKAWPHFATHIITIFILFET